MDLHASKEALCAHEEIGEGLTDFLTGLWDVLETIEPYPWVPTNETAVWEKVREEQSCYFAFDAPQITGDYFAEVFKTVFLYIAPRTSGIGKTDVANVLDSAAALSNKEVQSGLLDTKKLMRILVGRAAQAKDTEQLAALAAAVHLSALSALEPTATAAADQLTVPEKSVLSRKDGSCPVCGRPADMGVLKDVGKLNGGPRELWCSFCNTLWDYQRIRCTRCGSRIQTQLSFHFNEGDRAHRIYYCKECSGSQKVVDLRELENLTQFDFRVESIAMAGLEDAVRSHNESTLGGAQPKSLTSEQERAEDSDEQ